MMRWAPDTDAVVAFAVFIFVVILNSLAWSVDVPLWNVLAYHVLLALGLCIVFPTWYWGLLRGRALSEIGLSLQGWGRSVAIGLALAAVTVPPRLVGASAPSAIALGCLTAAMTFSTMFEEVFFRGFLQTRMDKAFGAVPAIVLSGVTFSLYHVGYDPYFRHVGVIGGLTFVGMLFALAFQINRRVLTSFTLNLPHAIVTFVRPEMREYAESRRLFTGWGAVFGLAIVAMALLWMRFVIRRQNTSQEGSGAAFAAASRKRARVTGRDQ